MITHNIETITPTMASALLTNNCANRPLNIQTARRLASSIERGEWALNGDAIRIDNSGVLLDGQHRLKAVEISGKPIQTLVIRNLQPAVFTTIDQGRARSAGDTLAVLGHKHYSTLAGAARLLYLYNLTGTPFNNAAHLAPTSHQIADLVSKSPALAPLAAFTSNSRFIKAHIGPSVAAFAYFVFSQRSPLFAEQFFVLLESGVGLPSDSAILALRNQLIAGKSSVKSSNVGKQSLKPELKAAWLFRAFRHYVRDTPIKSIKVIKTANMTSADLFKLW